MNNSASGILFFFLDQLSAKWLEAAADSLPLPKYPSITKTWYHLQQCHHQ